MTELYEESNPRIDFKKSLHCKIFCAGWLSCSSTFDSLLSLAFHGSFSTDDDNDTEVEAVDVDTELNLVTECWVEPQSGTVMNCMDQHRHFQGLKYQEIPQAVCITNSYSS